MKFSLSQIRKNAYEQPFNFSGEIDVSDLESQNNDIRKIFPAKITGNCVIEGDEIVFTLTIAGKLILPCARTLVDVDYDYAFEVIEVFSTSSYYGEEEEANDIHQLIGELIDLTPYIKENIILNLPFRVYSKNKDDLEQALTDGDGWAFLTDDELQSQEQSEQSTSIDPRLKKLQSLLDEKEQNKD